MPRDTSTGGKRHEIVGALGIPGRIERDSANGAGGRSIGRSVVIKHLGICAKLDTHGVVVGTRLASDNVGRTESLRDAVLPGKLVEASGDVGDHVTNEKLGEVTIRETVCAGPNALLNRTNGTFDFANVPVVWDDVETDGADVVANTLKFFVGMYVTHDAEAAKLVGPDHILGMFEHRVVRAVRHRDGGAVADAAGDGVQEGDALDRKEIHA